MAKEITTFASLGMSCQTAHQLARYAERADGATFQKGPIDWLICPPEALVRWLDAGLPLFAQDEIESEREHAYWPRYDFWFWHGFYTKKENTPLLQIPVNTERELEKLTYQRGRFATLDPDTTLFVWSNTQNNLDTNVFTEDETGRYSLTGENLKKMENSLNDFFGKTCRVLFATRNDRCEKSVLLRSNVRVFPHEPSDWKGADSDWNKVLETYLAQDITADTM